MILPTLSLAALAALTSVASATSDLRFTKATTQRSLLFGRDLDIAYAPETTVCGEGATCAEACGTGYEQCFSNDDSAGHCFNPSAGETCCMFPGLGST
jgi:hypothetical protein